VKKKLTGATKIKGTRWRPAKENPQYLVESDTSGKQAAHKPGALKKRS
jgi:hypothetical protein